MKNLFLTLAILFLLIYDLSAKYTQTCTVRYKTEEGWSKKYTVDVTFISGTELNEATSSFKYSSFSIYAVIFWDKEQASVIEFNSFIGCGSVVEKNCITNVLGDLRGKDQNNIEWKICKDNLCY